MNDSSYVPQEQYKVKVPSEQVRIPALVLGISLDELLHCRRVCRPSRLGTIGDQLGRPVLSLC